MNKSVKHNLKFVVLLSLFSAILVGCASEPAKFWPEKSGRVLDYKTKEPMKDVHVLALWEGTGGVVGPQTRCYHVESAKTDEKGQFTIPVFFEGFGDGFLASRHIFLYFNAPNYFEPKYSQSYTDNIFYLEKFTGTPKEYFEFITTRGRGPSCHGAGESRRNTFIFHKAVYEEAKSLAKTKEEKQKVKWLRDVMASSIDANVVSLTGEKLEKRVEEILREQNLMEQEK